MIPDVDMASPSASISPGASIFTSAPAFAAFNLVRPAGEAGRYVFASPHSGMERPSDFGASPDIGHVALGGGEDRFVDRLVAAGPAHGAPVISGRVSRAYLDLNRDPAELDPALIDDCPPADLSAKTLAGFGVIPRRGGDGMDLYDRRLSFSEARTRIERLHRPYHATLADLMTQTRTRHGTAVLIDWHSMPSRAAGGTERSAPGPDVVLGDRFGAACDPGLTRRLRLLFEQVGWRVGLNAPYAGGYTTQAWGRPAEGFQAVQIELNRALYLNEATLEPSADFARCQAVMDRVVASVCSQE
ncbi:N-formylglutamate amidohydrolase [soil metagenome]